MGVLRTLGDTAEEEYLDPASMGILVPPRQFDGCQTELPVRLESDRPLRPVPPWVAADSPLKVPAAHARR
jgi:hypothetical protein